MQVYKFNIHQQKYFAKIKSFIISSTLMPISKFQDNIEMIDQGSQQFQKFLSQFKPRHSSPHSSQNNGQQIIRNGVSSQMGSQNRKSKEPSFSSQDLHENKSEFKQRFSPMQMSQSSHESSSKFEIRKLQRLNPTPSQFLQQDNIKNQHPGQLIVLKSANQLPPWLFEHIRKQNASRLKNICLKEDQQRHSQIYQSNERESQDENTFTKTKNRLAQRYLNQSYVARNQKSQMNPQTNRYQDNHFKNSQKNHNSRRDFRKISSSVQMPHFQKNIHFQNMNKTQKRQQIYINDYEYSYCPDIQTQQKRKSFKSANHKSGYFEQVSSKRMNSGQKTKSNQYRIRQQEKTNKIHPIPRIPAKRLPTVSQEQPLIEPKKYALC